MYKALSRLWKIVVLFFEAIRLYNTKSFPKVQPLKGEIVVLSESRQCKIVLLCRMDSVCQAHCLFALCQGSSGIGRQRLLKCVSWAGGCSTCRFLICHIPTRFSQCSTPMHPINNCTFVAQSASVIRITACSSQYALNPVRAKRIMLKYVASPQ